MTAPRPPRYEWGLSALVACGSFALRKVTGVQGRERARQVREGDGRGRRRVLHPAGGERGSLLHRPWTDPRAGPVAVGPGPEVPPVPSRDVPVHPRDPADEGRRRRGRTHDPGAVPVREW